MNKYMKVSFIKLMSLVVLLATLSACDNEYASTPEDGNWVEKSDFEGAIRSSAVSFVIDGIGYVGTGYDGVDRLKDFWAYDPERNTWVRTAEFPGAPRNGAIAFSIDGKGYVGTGYDGVNYLKDFYEYDPLTNQWTQLPDFEGVARHSAFGLGIEGKGYVGTGFDGDNQLKDFWAFDPTSNSWEQMTSVGGSKRINPIAFTIDGMAYVGGGVHNGAFQEDFWRYNPSTDSWEELNDLDHSTYGDDYVLRSETVSFVCHGKAYISTGIGNGTLTSTWMYDPSDGYWSEMTSFEGTARQGATGFSIDDVGYIVTGRNGSSRFDDIWAFFPLESYDDED
ncbi:Kelch repeat-containing protein [Roseivirga pacifica]|uniref:Kelch repeat-containing protein n=1 Tax=Roseivirga pacifica TaxID=1267423 RepID=UPI00227CBDDD|nr:kelch repeat-containing protein [Roseivirga pacifica]